jgi:hypothetical protein
MQVKQFLIEFEYNDTTRWPENDKEIAQFVASCASESVKYKTDGAFPLTRVYTVAGSHSDAQSAQGRTVVVLQLKEAVSK